MPAVSKINPDLKEERDKVANNYHRSLRQKALVVYGSSLNKDFGTSEGTQYDFPQVILVVGELPRDRTMNVSYTWSFYDNVTAFTRPDRDVA